MTRSYMVAKPGSRGAQGIAQIQKTIGVNVGGVGNLSAQQVNEMAKLKLEAKKQVKFAGAYVKHLKDYAAFTKEIEAKRAEAVKLGLEASDQVWKEIEGMEKTAAKLLSSIAEAGQRTQYGLTEIDAAHSGQMKYLGQVHQVNMYDIEQQMQTLLVEAGHKRQIASLGRYMNGGDYDPYTSDINQMTSSSRPIAELPASKSGSFQEKSWFETLLGR